MEKIENNMERIPGRDEILKVIGSYSEEFTVERELSDNQGIYLLEVKVKLPETGEVVEYGYMRKGIFPNHNESLETAVHIVFYEGGMPVGGHTLTVLNTETGEWKSVE